MFHDIIKYESGGCSGLIPKWVFDTNPEEICWPNCANQLFLKISISTYSTKRKFIAVNVKSQTNNSHQSLIFHSVCNLIAINYSHQRHCCSAIVARSDQIVSTFFPASESIKKRGKENHEQLPVHCTMPPRNKDSVSSEGWK